MPSRLSAQPVSTIPRNTQVRDYDQLSPRAKQVLAELTTERTAITVSSRVAACFDRDEIINYTDYLRIDT
jgi:hypothetical protein